MDRTLVPDELNDNDIPPGVDEGLRSAGGIRWLHWIGALVICVSVVGLLAARWGELPLAVQFLVLVAGAVTLYVAGDAAHRLRLPATTSALLFLFTGLLPLLAWGAAYLRLVEASFGWLSLGLGLGALLWGVRRVLDRVLDYRRWIYTGALAILLFAPPVLTFVQDHADFDAKLLFLAASIALGLVMRFASRHVNRFFFHRDRLAGVDRPVHFVPFALLALSYGAGMSLLSAHGLYLAVPLVFIGVALVDTGEEYFQALVKATSQVPERWPRRSVGLLASGFAMMAAAAAVSPFDVALYSTTLVPAIVSLRLFSWASRYQRGPAYAFALVSALVAYHASPILVVVGGVNLTGLGALAALVVLGGVLLLWLTEPMRRIHVAVTAFQGLVVLLSALPDLAGVRAVAPLTALVLLSGLLVLRRVELLPVLYLAVAGSAVTWAGALLGGPVAVSPADLWSLEAAAVLSMANLLFLGSALALRRFRPPAAGERPGDAAGWWIAGSPVVGTAVVALASLTWLESPATAGYLMLSAAGTAFLGGLVVRRVGVLMASILAAWGGAHLVVYAVGGGTALTAGLLGQAWLLGFWQLERRAGKRPETSCPLGGIKGGETFVGWARPAWILGALLGAIAGLMAWAVAVVDGSSALAAPHLVLLGLVLVDVAGRQLARGQNREDEGFAERYGPARRDSVALPFGLGLVILWLPIQLAALGALSHPATFLLFAGAAVFGMRRGLAQPAVTSRISRVYGVREESLRSFFLSPMAAYEKAWSVLAVPAVLVFAGYPTFCLALALAVTMIVHVRRDRASGDQPRESAVVAYALATLLPVVQLAALPAGRDFLLPALLEQGFGILPLLACATLVWRVVSYGAVDRGFPHSRTLLACVEGTLAAGWLFSLGDAFIYGTVFTPVEHAALLAVALGRAAFELARGWQSGQRLAGWWVQGWIAVAALQAVAAGWLEIGTRFGALALLLAAVAERVTAEVLERRERAVLARPCYPLAFAFAALAGALAAFNTLDTTGSPWWPILPGFMASLFFVHLARNGYARGVSSLAAVGFFATSLTVLVYDTQYLGSELYWLGPGLALIGLSRLLEHEIGARWSSRLFIVGAGCLYAMPILGLFEELTWGWQIVMLLLAIAFGAASFRLRNRSLLTLSTAAVVIDLGCFVFKVGKTAPPAALWAMGILFGLSLMACATLLEYRRELLLQKFRVWGQEIRSWT